MGGVILTSIENNQAMSTLPKQIAEKFLEELAKSEDVTEAQINGLRELIERPSTLKATDIDIVFTAPEEDVL